MWYIKIEELIKKFLYEVWLIEIEIDVAPKAWSLLLFYRLHLRPRQGKGYWTKCLFSKKLFMLVKVMQNFLDG